MTGWAIPRMMALRRSAMHSPRGVVALCDQAVDAQAARGLRIPARVSPK